MAIASLVSRTQIIFGIAVMGSSLALAAACSSTTTTGSPDGGATSGGTSGATSGGTSGATSGGTSGATSGGTSGGTSGAVGMSKCGSSGGMSTNTCTQAEVDTYNNCNFSMCDAEYQAALGSGYKTGSYSGACGTYLTCVNACACGDTACQQKCGLPDSACQTALGNASTCSQTKCPQPACFKSGTDAGTSGTSGSSGSVAHTCADFASCCAAKSGSDQTTCQQVYDAIKGSGDASCNAAFSSYCP
jgi:hypothetical protein